MKHGIITINRVLLLVLSTEEQPKVIKTVCSDAPLGQQRGVIAGTNLSLPGDGVAEILPQMSLKILIGFCHSFVAAL